MNTTILDKIKSLVQKVLFSLYLKSIGMSKQQYWHEVSITELLVYKERLKESNELLRSAYSIAERDGIQTNWEAFRNQVMTELKLQKEFGI